MRRDSIILIPSDKNDKPIKVLIENEYKAEKTQNGLTITQKIHMEYCIRLEENKNVYK